MLRYFSLMLFLKTIPKDLALPLITLFNASKTSTCMLRPKTFKRALIFSS